MEEQRVLLAETAKQPYRWNMTGVERSLLYRTILGTGLRMREVSKLTAGAFDLKGKPPTLTIPAAVSKHRREDVLPLPAELVPLLREHLRTKLPDAPAWPPVHEGNYGRMFGADLNAARAAWLDQAEDKRQRREREQTSFLAREDAGGRVLDAYSLRHSFCTNLARAGVHPRMLMELARHRDVQTTMQFYTHVVLAEQAEALAKVASLDQPAEADRGAKRSAT